MAGPSFVAFTRNCGSQFSHALRLRDLGDDGGVLRAPGLEELDDALNIKKQSQRVAERMTASYQQNPTPWWIGAGVVAVAAVSAVAWALFGDD